MKATTIGLNIAKTVSQVHGVDRTNKTVMRKQLKRARCWRSSPTSHRR